MVELEQSGMSRNKEQAAMMLHHLISHAPSLLQIYTQPILKVLVPKLKEQDPNPNVVINVLTVIGDLAQVSFDLS